ncbi:MAG TPA: hypothetical protein VNW92_12425, partial [Polyangiaceae bacterium]|nr:hypothetical protein [Polyangiaceae bacterium]
SLGLVAALRLGAKLAQTPAELSERTVDLLRRLGLPVALDAATLGAAAKLIGHDKKRAGASVLFIFAREVGRVEAQAIALNDLVAQVPTLAS